MIEPKKPSEGNWDFFDRYFIFKEEDINEFKSK